MSAAQPHQSPEAAAQVATPDASLNAAASGPVDAGLPSDNDEGDARSPGSQSAAPIDPNAQLSVRALVSTKEAGVIIGKGGANVADLRDKTGVKAGVSKVVQGVHDRVLSVSGTLDGISKVRYTRRAYSTSHSTRWRFPAISLLMHDLLTPFPVTTSGILPHCPDHPGEPRHGT